MQPLKGALQQQLSGKCFRSTPPFREPSRPQQPVPRCSPVEGSRKSIRSASSAQSRVKTAALETTTSTQEILLVVDACETSQAAESTSSLSENPLQHPLYSALPGWATHLNATGLWLPSEQQLSILQLPIRTTDPPAQQVTKQTPAGGRDPNSRGDFYANVGKAIRTLRAEIPLLFQQELTYDIYRDDITFRDPRNAFHGKKDYQTIFWSLRFHGKLFFKMLYVDVLRIWESPENISSAGTVLKMRWTVHGVPRVPWDAEGIFDGISTFKLDSNGKIYEHSVNNIILRDPPKQGNPFLAGLNLIPLQPQQQPCPGAWFKQQLGVQMTEDGTTKNGSDSDIPQLPGVTFVEDC